MDYSSGNGDPSGSGSGTTAPRTDRVQEKGRPVTETNLNPRPSYYLMSHDLGRGRNPSAFTFVNEDKALINGRTAGTHPFQWPDRNYPSMYGVPPLRERPKLRIPGAEGRRLDIYGFSPRFVSSRAKALMEKIDAEAFEFAECDTVDGRGNRIEPYWMMDVIRIADFDTERSSFVRYVDLYPDARNHYSSFSVAELNDVLMPEGFPRDNHVFWFWRYSPDFVVDADFKKAWDERGFTGAFFTPLQAPTQDEWTDDLPFPYRKYWAPKLGRDG